MVATRICGHKQLHSIFSLLCTVGAAIHCWPAPLAALAEISRVLKPGGIFVGTTFLQPLAPLGEIIGDDTVRTMTRMVVRDRGGPRMMKPWEERELRDLAQAVGLVDFRCHRVWQYIMFTATKPSETEPE